MNEENEKHFSEEIIKFLREDKLITELHKRTKITLNDILNGNTTVRVPELMTGENVGDLPTVDFWGLTTSYEGLNEDECRRIDLGKAEHFEEVFYAALLVLSFNLNTLSPVHQIVNQHLMLVRERSYRMNNLQGKIKAGKENGKVRKAEAEQNKVKIRNWPVSCKSIFLPSSLLLSLHHQRTRRSCANS